MVLSGKVVLDLSEQAYGKEGGADDNVETMEASSYEEGGAIDAVRNGEWGFVIL